MKKFFLLGILLIASFTVKAQQLDLMTAQEAYDLLLASPDYVAESSVIMVQAMKIQQMPTLEIDYSTCKGNLWTISCKSTDTSNHLATIYAIFSMSGFPMVQAQEQEINGNAQDMPKLDVKYLENSGLAVAIAKNTEFMKYINENSGLFLVEQISLSGIPKTDSISWTIGATLDSTDSYYCNYEPVKYDLLGCQRTVQTDIKEIIASALNASPNPAGDYVKISAPVSGSAKIEFINTVGLTEKALDMEFNQNAVISTKDLPKGVYIVKLNVANTIYTQKVVVN